MIPAWGREALPVGLIVIVVAKPCFPLSLDPQPHPGFLHPHPSSCQCAPTLHSPLQLLPQPPHPPTQPWGLPSLPAPHILTVGVQAGASTIISAGGPSCLWPALAGDRRRARLGPPPTSTPARPVASPPLPRPGPLMWPRFRLPPAPSGFLSEPRWCRQLPHRPFQEPRRAVQPLFCLEPCPALPGHPGRSLPTHCHLSGGPPKPGLPCTHQPWAWKGPEAESDSSRGVKVKGDFWGEGERGKRDRRRKGDRRQDVGASGRNKGATCCPWGPWGRVGAGMGTPLSPQMSPAGTRPGPQDEWQDSKASTLSPPSEHANCSFCPRPGQARPDLTTPSKICGCHQKIHR